MKIGEKRELLDRLIRDADGLAQMRHDRAFAMDPTWTRENYERISIALADEYGYLAFLVRQDISAHEAALAAIGERAKAVSS